MHRAFDKKIADLKGEKQHQNKQHDKVNIPGFDIMENKISNHANGNKYVECFPLNPVGDIHIGVSSCFHIPYQPDDHRNDDH